MVIMIKTKLPNIFFFYNVFALDLDVEWHVVVSNYQRLVFLAFHIYVFFAIFFI